MYIRVMSKHLIEDVTPITTPNGFSNLNPESLDPKPCHMVIIYDDQEVRNRVARICANLRRLFSEEIDFLESWWKFSFLRS